MFCVFQVFALSSLSGAASRSVAPRVLSTTAVRARRRGMRAWTTRRVTCTTAGPRSGTATCRESATANASRKTGSRPSSSLRMTPWPSSARRRPTSASSRSPGRARPTTRAPRTAASSRGAPSRWTGRGGLWTTGGASATWSGAPPPPPRLQRSHLPIQI